MNNNFNSTPQETIESKLEKKRKTLLGAPANRRVVIYVDDVNMPLVEEYGAQVRFTHPPLQETVPDTGGHGSSMSHPIPLLQVQCSARPLQLFGSTGYLPMLHLIPLLQRDCTLLGHSSIPFTWGIFMSVHLKPRTLSQKRTTVNTTPLTRRHPHQFAIPHCHQLQTLLY